MTHTKYIAHIDMDAFFASIEQRDNPSFRGKPVIVGADPKKGKGRGVVSTCSYEARTYGIHSAMPISTAYNKCPHGIFLPPNMKKYSTISDTIYDILYTFTPDIEMTSIDEAFLDISRSFHLFGSPHETCRKIKSKIKKETSLTASVGLGPSKMVAKIASDLNKPDGLTIVNKKTVFDFLNPLPIKCIWGIGPKMVEHLHSFGIQKIGDLAKRSRKELTVHFGTLGEHFWNLAHGIDDSEIYTICDSKSISNEITFDEDTNDKNTIESTLLYLCEKVSNRLRKEGLRGITITLKIRLTGFKTYTRSRTLKSPVNFVSDIYTEIQKFYTHFGLKNKKVRLLGVKVSNFTQQYPQPDLFDTVTYPKKEKIHIAIDMIKERYGFDAIYHARK